LLGLSRERAESALAAAQAWLAEHRATATIRPGLTPHAPYSVRDDLFLRAGLLARSAGVALSVHLAETGAELELLAYHSGPFVAFLTELGVWDADGLSADLQRVVNLCDQHVPQLFVHGNYLPPGLHLPPRGSVVYCPRTHAFFGHAPHPFRDLLSRGVRVALGTDSLASNPDLDLLAEARFLHRRHPDLPGATLLRLATLAGAEALGWADETGSLEPGKSADLVVVPLAGQGANLPHDPHDLVLASDAPVARVLCRGRWLP
jgi:cytosine/adenosine deaminase-related metal-dependent hydrolase